MTSEDIRDMLRQRMYRLRRNSEADPEAAHRDAEDLLLMMLETYREDGFVADYRLARVHFHYA